MKVDIRPEIRFRTARSGGKGGQNVNKVETMVEGLLDLEHSTLLSNEQKAIIREKLAARINRNGELTVKSQSDRTQLGNKEMVIEKMNLLLHEALKKKKSRISTKPSAGSKEARIRQKKRIAEIKSGRQKYRPTDE